MLTEQRKNSPFIELIFKDRVQVYVVTNKAELKQALKKAEDYYSKVIDSAD